MRFTGIESLCFIVCLVITSFSSLHGAAGDPQLQWDAPTGADVRSPALLADLNGDGYMEIIIGSNDYYVYGLDHNGNSLPGWPRSTDNTNQSVPAAADIDEDGDLEVAFHSDDDYLYMWHYDGTNQPGWPYQGPDTDPSRTSPSFCDFDEDGFVEVTMLVCDAWGGGYDSHLMLWNYLGPPAIWDEYLDYEATYYNIPAIGDMTGDLIPDIVVGRNTNVFIYESTGSRLITYTTGGNIDASPALADIDKDGDLEIFVGADNSRVYGWHHDGTDILGWPVSTGGQVDSSPAIGDLNDDGYPEVVVGCTDGRLYAWDRYGSTLPSFPIDLGSAITSSPALADIDDDGELEIVVGCNDYNVYAFNNDGSLLPNWPIATGNYVLSSPALADIDGDGAMEVVFGSYDNRIYCYDLGLGSYNPYRMPWPSIGQNPRNTRLYEGEQERIVTFRVVPFQTMVPRGGTLDFRIDYTNWHLYSEQAEVVMEAYLPEGTTPVMTWSDNLTFSPGDSSKYYSPLVPSVAPAVDGYRLEINLIYPVGSGQVAWEGWLGFDVTPAMSGMPLMDDPLGWTIEEYR